MNLELIDIEKIKNNLCTELRRLDFAILRECYNEIKELKTFNSETKIKFYIYELYKQKVLEYEHSTI